MQLRATVAVVDTVDIEGQSLDSLVFAILRGEKRVNSKLPVRRL